MVSSPLFWPPLLFRQICILAGVLGILFLRHPQPALLGLLFLWLLDWPRSRALPPLLGILAGFALGALLGFGAEPPHSISMPSWAVEATTPTDDTKSSYARGVLVSGRIRETNPLPEGRLRVILEQVRPVSAGNALPPLPAGLVLSWRNPPPELVAAGPGQQLRAVLRLRTVRAFANPGVWETESYWQDREVRYRAWNKDDGSDNGKNPPLALEGTPSPFWAARHGLYTGTMRNLPQLNDGERSPNGQVTLTPSSAVLLALIFGDTSALSAEERNIVAKATLSHSLALSGMHLGYAAALGYTAVALLGFVAPAFFLRIPRPRLGLALALPLAAAYLWLGAAPPSLLRAALMLLFWAYLLWRNKPKVLLDGLVWAVALILLLSPLSLYDIRLQLSALAVAAIILVAPLLERLMQMGKGRPPPFLPLPVTHFNALLHITKITLRHRVLPPVAAMLLLSLASQIALLPLTINAFSNTGLWFPLNVLWLPVLGIFIMPLAFAGLFCTAASWDFAARTCFQLAGLPCGWLLDLLNWMESSGILYAPAGLRPHWLSSLGFWLLLLCLPILTMRREFTRRMALLACCAFLMLVSPSILRALETQRDVVRLRLMDVGQGQAVVLEWPGGRAIIDGGGFASGNFDTGRHILAPALTDNHPPELDWLVNTHPDTDHLRGLLDLLDRFRVGGFVRAEAESGKGADAARRDKLLIARRTPTRQLKAGESLILDSNLRLDVLHPSAKRSGASSNSNSLVLRLVWQGKGLALICGDVEKTGLRQLRTSDVTLTADVLIVPHHGSAGSLDPQLYDTVRPKLALASCGYGNQWNFPSAKVRDALAARNIPLRTTADQGQIEVEWQRDGSMKTRFARKGEQLRTSNPFSPKNAPARHPQPLWPYVLRLPGFAPRPGPHPCGGGPQALAC